MTLERCTAIVTFDLSHTHPHTRPPSPFPAGAITITVTLPERMLGALPARTTLALITTPNLQSASLQTPRNKASTGSLPLTADTQAWLDSIDTGCALGQVGAPTDTCINQSRDAGGAACLPVHPCPLIHHHHHHACALQVFSLSSLPLTLTATNCSTGEYTVIGYPAPTPVPTPSPVVLPPAKTAPVAKHGIVTRDFLIGVIVAGVVVFGVFVAAVKQRCCKFCVCTCKKARRSSRHGPGMLTLYCYVLQRECTTEPLPSLPPVAGCVC
jgi:hypothetical protein